MLRYLYKIIFPVLVLFCLTSCESFWNLVLGENQNTPQSVKGVEKTNTTSEKPPEKTGPIDFKAHCKNLMTTQPQIVKYQFSDDDSVDIEIDSNKIYDEASLLKWTADLSHLIFVENHCSFDAIRFLCHVDEAAFYQGVIRQNDADLYSRGKISKPEWHRRFEIKKMDSLVSLKAQLMIARHKKEHDRALGLIEKLKDSESGNFNLKMINYNILLDQKLYQEAIMGYESLKSIEPRHPGVLFNLAFALKQAGRFSDAIKIYKDMSQTMTEDLKDSLPFKTDDVLLHLIDAELKNNELDAAESDLERIKDKSSRSYQLFKANLLRARGESDGAKQILDEVIKNDANDSLALFNRVLIDLDLKDEKAAQESFQNLKKVDEEMAEELSFLPIFKSGSESSEEKLPVDLKKEGLDEKQPDDNSDESGEEKLF